MKGFLENRWFLLVLRLVVGGTFIYAGASKIGDPLAFADSIATFEVLPAQLINLVAIALPPFEVMVGGFLVIGIFKEHAALSLLILTGLFMILLLQAIVRRLEVDCGCFGSGEPSVWSAWVSLGRNVVLACCCGWIWMQNRRPTTVDK